MDELRLVLLEPAKTILSQVSQFLMSVLLVLIILIIGWIISGIIKSLVTKLLKTVKLDELAEKIELDALLAKGGISYSISELIGVMFYWIGILVTFVVAMNAINLPIAAELLNKVILFVPNIIVAIFIIILGMFVATMLKNIVLTAANNAGVSQSAFLSKVVETIVIVFVIMIALDQLKINAKILEDTVRILLAALGLGLALAFGLGCKDIAGKFTADLIEKLKSKK
jgi:hypothetical protein